MSLFTLIYRCGICSSRVCCFIIQMWDLQQVYFAYSPAFSLFAYSPAFFLFAYSPVFFSLTQRFRSTRPSIPGTCPSLVYCHQTK